MSYRDFWRYIFCVAIAALILPPCAFSQQAETIGFDNLPLGAEITSVLTMQGIFLQSADGTPVKVVDAKAMGGNRPHSKPHAISAISKGLPLEILFTSPRRKVGLYFGNVEGDVKAVLSAYSDENELLEQSSIITIGASL